VSEQDSGFNKDSIGNIILIAVLVCLGCSIVVSSAAVGLKSLRSDNKALDRSKNVLMAAGLAAADISTRQQIQDEFAQFEPVVLDLRDKRMLSSEEAIELDIDVATFDQRSAAKDPLWSSALETPEDIASIKRREHYAVGYLLRSGADIEKIVLPIHGYGLWSTLYGFLALEGDGNTVAGITFYEHGETAGLGGEVDNPAWKALWPGKAIYADDGRVALKVVKGAVNPKAAGAEHQVDGLSGATLTSRGVENLVSYWMGDAGYGPILKTISE
jgi:Na+-transporting NADH:ubiquinone oxidoreductase subunit C